MIGEIFDRVTLLNPPSSGSQNALGELTGDWVTVGKFWAKVQSVSGGMTLQAGGLVPGADYQVKVRFWPGFAAGQRILWRGKTLTVGHVSDSDRSGYIVLDCKWEKP